jgi:hypothetical protein
VVGIYLQEVLITIDLRLIFLFILILLSLPKFSFGQTFYRLKSDFTIKEKLVDGSYRLTMGKVYYDKINKKIVYKLTFPKRETHVIQDTLIYTIDQNNKIINKVKSGLIPEFTIFHLVLTGKLTNYGLKPKEDEKPLYKIAKVEKQGNGILSTWTPTESQFKKMFGEIKMFNVNKSLEVLLVYDPKKKLKSRQFFKKYENINGILMPTEVTNISYGENGSQNIQLTTYKNIKIDQNNEDEIYRYKLPINKLVGSKK